MPMRPETPLIRNAISCDADDCSTWSRDPEAHGFVELRWGTGEVSSFCSPGCALKWLAAYANFTEEVP